MASGWVELSQKTCVVLEEKQIINLLQKLVIGSFSWSRNYIFSEFEISVF